MPKKRKPAKPRRTLPPQPGMGAQPTKAVPPAKATPPPKPAPPATVEEAPRRERTLAQPEMYGYVRQDLKRIALYAGLLFGALGVLRVVLG